MTKRLILREEVTDCNVGDVLKTLDGTELMCTGKVPMGEITFIETENREETSFIAMMADKLEQHKHEIDYTFFHKKPYYMAISATSCHGNWKDARFIAVETLKVAGYDPSKYNFDVKATAEGCYIVTITVKEGE